MFPRARNNPRPHPIGGRGTNRTNYKRELVLNLKTKGVGQEELLRIRIAERSNPAVWIGEDRNVIVIANRIANVQLNLPVDFISEPPTIGEPDVDVQFIRTEVRTGNNR